MSLIPSVWASSPLETNWSCQSEQAKQNKHNNNNKTPKPQELPQSYSWHIWAQRKLHLELMFCRRNDAPGVSHLPAKELNLLSAASFPGRRWNDLENQILQRAIVSKFGDLGDAKTMSLQVCFPLPISSAQGLHDRVYIKVPSIPKEASFLLCTNSSTTDTPLFQTGKLYFLSLLTIFTHSLYPNPARFSALPSPQPLFIHSFIHWWSSLLLILAVTMLLPLNYFLGACWYATSTLEARVSFRGHPVFSKPCRPPSSFPPALRSIPVSFHIPTSLSCSYLGGPQGALKHQACYYSFACLRRVDGSRLHWLTGNHPQAFASIHHASDYSWHH